MALGLLLLLLPLLLPLLLLPVESLDVGSYRVSAGRLVLRRLLDSARTGSCGSGRTRNRRRHSCGGRLLIGVAA